MFVNGNFYPKNVKTSTKTKPTIIINGFTSIINKLEHVDNDRVSATSMYESY